MSDAPDKLASLLPRQWKAKLEDETKAAERRFRPVFPSAFPTPEAAKLVRGLIGHRDLVLVYGGWGTGKSFFVVDLACCIAFGDFWRGRASDPGGIIYVAGEAPRSIQNRIRAWMMRRGKVTRGAAEPPIGVIETGPDLLNGAEEVEELAQEIAHFRQASGVPLRAIVFDTLHSCAPGSKEDAADTAAVLRHVRALGARFGCAIILVHHAGKDPSKGARGSVSLEAAADVIIEIAEDGGVRTPSARKLRDDAAPELEPFVIDSVIFGQGSDDEVRVGVHELTEPEDDPTDPKQAKAVELRGAGLSFSLIAKSLGVSKRTAERWAKGINH